MTVVDDKILANAGLAQEGEDTPPEQAQRIGAILQGAFLLYVRHWRSFTQQLVLPVFWQLVGLLIAIIGPIRMVNYMERAYDIHEPAWLIAGMLAPFLPGVYLFGRGFWEYLVYMVSLNRNAAQVIHQASPEFKPAYRHVTAKATAFTNVLLAYMALWMLPVACILLPPVLLAGLGPAWTPWLSLGGMVLAGVMMLVVAVLSVYFSLGFQVLAFESVTANPFKVLQRSYQLVDGNFCRVLAIALVLGVLTNLVLPNLLTLVLDLAQVTAWISTTLAQGLVAEVMENVKLAPVLGYDAAVVMVDDFLMTHVSDVSMALVQSTMVSLVTFFLLPLGTFAFTLLYGDLMARGHSTSIEEALTPEL